MSITPEEMSLYLVLNFQSSDMHVRENVSLRFEHLHVTVFEVEKCLRNPKRKAFGPDCIPY